MGGWLYKHENITNSASNSVEVGAGAELGNKTLDRQEEGDLSNGQYLWLLVIVNLALNDW